jgi:Mce-associated membrane protein
LTDDPTRDARHDDDSHEPPGTTTRVSRTSPSLRTVMAATLAVLLVVAGGVAVWSYLRLDDAQSRLDARADVARVAEQFAVEVNNYDSESIDGYRSSVSRLLSTKFRAEFDKAMQDIVAQVQEAEMESEGEVLASGVATIDDDSARVLVVADAAVKTVFDDRQRHFRWEVALVKVDGEWLVDDFTPVA